MNRPTSLVISLIIHGALVFAMMKITYDYALPEGDVITADFKKGEPVTGETQQFEVKESRHKSAPQKSVVAAPKEVITAKDSEDESPIPPAPVVANQIQPAEEEKSTDKPTETLPEKKKEEAKPVVAKAVDPEPEESEEDEDGEETDDDNDAPAGNTEIAEQISDDPGTGGGVRSESELTPVSGNPKPSYPMAARLRRQEGIAIVDFFVDDSGSVSNAKVVKSSGFSMLDEEAISTQKKWKYQPGKVGVFRKEFIFRLRGNTESLPYRPK